MNNPNAWLQLVLYVGALLLITKPLGLYLVRVLDSQGSHLSRLDCEAVRAGDVPDLRERVFAVAGSWRFAHRPIKLAPSAVHSSQLASITPRASSLP